MGLSEAQWFSTMERGEPLPLPVGEAVDYRGFTRLGPGALLYLGIYAMDHGQPEAAQGFFEAALKYEKTWRKTRAARFLADTYRDSADSSKLLNLLHSGAPALSPYRNSILTAQALGLDGRHDQALSAWRKLRLEFPQDSAREAASVTVGMIKSILSIGKPANAAELAELVAGLLNMRSSIAVQEGFTAILETSQNFLKEDAVLLVQIRAAANDRDYGLAIRTMKAYLLRANDSGGSESPAPTPNVQSLAAAYLAGGSGLRERINGLSYTVLADFARSYFYGAQSDGEVLFTLLSGGAGLTPDRDYLFQFYAGRFTRIANKLDESRKYFSKAAQLAPSSADRDAALWYLADSYLPAGNMDAIRVLADAFSKTQNPGYFSDLVEQISRDALLKRNGSALAALDAACGTRAEGKCLARISYICARGAELGIIGAAQIPLLPGAAKILTPKEYSSAHYRRAYNQDDEQWYRLLSAYRLGLPLDAWLDASAETAALAPSPAEGNGGYGNLGKDFIPADYALELLRWRLPSRIRTELAPYFDTMSPADIRRVAEALAAADAHAESIRVIGKVFGRKEYRVADRDRELFWPMPFRAEMDAASTEADIASALFYGLVRSESLFMPTVVSRAGAIGLSQLMPTTAAETARKIGMSEYSLENPSDNIRIGAAFFKGLLRSNKGGVLPALFSYNGGPTRYRRWKGEAGDLPDDLLLETLALEETRQYGRNVIHAAAMYSILHDDTDGKAFLKYALGE